MKTMNDLFDEVRDMDIEDPKSMQKVLEYWEELLEESDNFMLLLVEKLEHAVITWNRPWYQESTAIRMPVLDDETHETTFKTGILSLDECERVEKNWRKFRKRYDVPDKLSTFARWKRRVLPDINISYDINAVKARQYLTAYLSRGLQRTVCQVYRHVIAYYSRPRKGQYTEDEKKVMDICFYHNPKRATIILTDVLERDPKGINLRLSYKINGKHERNRINWNLALATKFVKSLMKCTGDSLLELKNKSLGMDVWRKLEGEFGTQGEYLRQFWYTTLHVQIFCKRDITLRRLRRKVFKILRRSPYRIWRDIKWKDVVAELPDGLTYQFVYWITVRVFRRDKTRAKLPIQDLVNIGLSKTNNKNFGNKRLKNLIFNEEGNLEVIKYEKKC